MLLVQPHVWKVVQTPGRHCTVRVALSGKFWDGAFDLSSNELLTLTFPFVF